jgi:hypothetical protein
MHFFYVNLINCAECHTPMIKHKYNGFLRFVHLGELFYIFHILIGKNMEGSGCDLI